jgi:NAD(P)-dependent dehydrogenase (short-subunit alcohol dehydrogenase family)
MNDLSGRVALVTGGTKGIGRAISEALVKAGCHVAVSARTADDVNPAEGDLAALGQTSPGALQRALADSIKASIR